MPRKGVSTQKSLILSADLPHTMKPNMFYDEAQLRIAVARMDQVGRKPPTHFTREKVIGFFKTWHLYVLVPRACSDPSGFPTP